MSGRLNDLALCKCLLSRAIFRADQTSRRYLSLQRPSWLFVFWTTINLRQLGRSGIVRPEPLICRGLSNVDRSVANFVRQQVTFRKLGFLRVDCSNDS